MPFGVCEDYVQIACAAMRGCGIPSAVDFTPQWPFRAQGHSWNVVLANDGRNLPFSGVETNPQSVPEGCHGRVYEVRGRHGSRR